VHGTEGIARAVEAGVDTLEHVSWFDVDGRGSAFDEAVARKMAERGIYANIASSPLRSLVERGRPGDRGMTASARSTADSAGHPVEVASGAGGRVAQAADGHVPETAGVRPALARWEFARRMIELGVPVCFSTDAIYGYWDDGHDLSYLAQALVEIGGFAPLDVLRMITSIPARAIGLGDQIGTVEPQRLADLLVVEGDPTQDIRALHQVRAVYQEAVLAPLA
jgi:imidazolonepropionase-like amidohydrolase